MRIRLLNRILSRVMVKAASAAALSALMLTSIPALAWNETGHRIIAQIAWDELTPSQQQFAADLLSKHPRFAEDFEARMPGAVKALPATSPERGRWLFAQAAAWPDMVKDESKRLAKQIAGATSAQQKSDLEKKLAEYKLYDNAAWHFDNKPIYLDPYALLPPPSAGSSPRPMGIQGALPKSLKELYDPSLSPEKRAVALAWVAHLLGDAHQPLHTSAIFSSKHLPQGDLGGNRIAIKLKQQPQDPEISLHQMWDDLFGDDPTKEKSIKRAIVVAFPRKKLQQELADPDPAATSSEESFTNLLLDESYRVADASVYDASIRSALLALKPTGAAYPTLTVENTYTRKARAAATRRLALAGYRLAGCVSRAESRKTP